MKPLKYNEKVEAYVDPAAIGLLSETEKSKHRPNTRSMTLVAAHLILQHGLVQQLNAPGTLADVDRLMEGLHTRLRLVAGSPDMLNDGFTEVEPPAYTWLNADTRLKVARPVYTAIPMALQPRSFFFEQYGINATDNNDRLQQTGISSSPVTPIQRAILMSYLQPAGGAWE